MSSRWSDETLLKEYKQNIGSKKNIGSKHTGTWTKAGCDNAPVTSGWQKSTKMYSDEFMKCFHDARKTNFDIKKLTKRELDFLLEYVCN